SFAPGIPVTLGGTVELTFAPDVNLASQIGRTFDLFNWTGVNPTAAFAVVSPYRWDLSNLYTTGEITLTAIPEPASVTILAHALPRARQRHNPRRRARPLHSAAPATHAISKPSPLGRGQGEGALLSGSSPSPQPSPGARGSYGPASSPRFASATHSRRKVMTP